MMGYSRLCVFFFFLVEAKMYVLLVEEGCSMLKIIEGAWMSLVWLSETMEALICGGGLKEFVKF